MHQTVRIVQEVDTVPFAVVVALSLTLEKARNDDGTPLTYRQMQTAARAALTFCGVTD